MCVPVPMPLTPPQSCRACKFHPAVTLVRIVLAAIARGYASSLVRVRVCGGRLPLQPRCGGLCYPPPPSGVTAPPHSVGCGTCGAPPPTHTHTHARTHTHTHTPRTPTHPHTHSPIRVHRAEVILFETPRVDRARPFDVHRVTWAYRITPISFRTRPPTGYSRTVIPPPLSEPRATIPPKPRAFS